MISPLENLCGPAKSLRQEPPDAKEFAGLMRSGRTRLADAQNPAIALESGFASLRNILRVQRRVTSSFKMRAGRSLTVRKASQPEAELAPLYTALALDPNPGGTKKLIV